MEYVVQLVDRAGIIVRDCVWLTQEGAEHQAKNWSEIFPQNFVFINNEKVYNAGWEVEGE